MIPRQNFFETLLTQHACALATLIAVQQETAEFFGPGFLMLFVEKLQLAQMMFIAEGVKTIAIGEVRLEVIVDNPVFAARQNVEIVHGFDTSFGMNAIEGPLRVADDVQPMEFLGYTDSAFVAMKERSLGEQIHQS